MVRAYGPDRKTGFRTKTSPSYGKDEGIRVNIGRNTRVKVLWDICGNRGSRGEGGRIMAFNDRGFGKKTKNNGTRRKNKITAFDSSLPRGVGGSCDG